MERNMAECENVVMVCLRHYLGIFSERLKKLKKMLVQAEICISHHQDGLPLT
jgi:hypothetical protein